MFKDLIKKLTEEQAKEALQGFSVVTDDGKTGVIKDNMLEVDGGLTDLVPERIESLSKPKSQPKPVSKKEEPKQQTKKPADPKKK